MCILLHAIFQKMISEKKKRKDTAEILFSPSEYSTNIAVEIII